MDARAQARILDDLLTDAVEYPPADQPVHVVVVPHPGLQVSVRDGWSRAKVAPSRS